MIVEFANGVPGAARPVHVRRRRPGTEREPAGSPATWPSSKRPFPVTRCGSVNVPRRRGHGHNIGHGVRRGGSADGPPCAVPRLPGCELIEHLHLLGRESVPVGPRRSRSPRACGRSPPALQRTGRSTSAARSNSLSSVSADARQLLGRVSREVTAASASSVVNSCRSATPTSRPSAWKYARSPTRLSTNSARVIPRSSGWAVTPACDTTRCANFGSLPWTWASATTANEISSPCTWSTPVACSYA